MRLNISHSTTYRYQNSVPYGLQQLRLTPKPYHGQQVIRWETHIEGGRKELEYEDHNLNKVQLVKVFPHQTELIVRCEGEVETVDRAGVVGEHISHIPLWLYKRSTTLTKAGAGVKKLVKTLGDGSYEDEISRLHALSALIVSEVSYETGNTFVNTSAEQAIQHQSGVCQDHAHIFVSAARSLGFSARYVSGYLMMDDRIDQEATHAWAEAHIKGLGWVGFDISNQISPDSRYVRVASGLDYRDCAPVTGLRLGTGDEELIVSLQVQQ